MTLAVLSFMLLVTMVPAGRSAGRGAAPSAAHAAMATAARRVPNGVGCPDSSRNIRDGVSDERRAEAARTATA